MKQLAKSSAGIAYALLVVAGLILLAIEQIDSDTDEEILSYYSDSGNRTSQIVGFALVTVGVLFFVWFVSVLRSRLAAGERGPKPLSFLAFGAGIAAAALLLAAAALLVSTSFAKELSSDFVVDPNLARLVVSVGYLLLIGSALISCVLVAATSVLALRGQVLPVWLGWVGFVAVVLAVAESFLLPVFIIPLWVVTVCIVWMVREARYQPRSASKGN